jgi:arylsulfatase A-like enzyme
MVVAEIEGAKGERARRIADQDNRIYDSGIAMADALVGRLVQSLKDSGLWENTILVLFSDHGEELWDADLPYKWYGPNHGFHVYGDGHLKVLMAIRFPDGKMAGQRVSQPVRLIDLAPTVAEMIGLDWPNAVDGKSMLAVARGEEPTDRLVYMETGLSEPRYWVKGHKKYPFKKVSKRYSVSTETGRVHIRPKFRAALIENKDRAVQMGDHKLIWHSVKEGMRVELYNRREDVLNRVDLSEDHPEIVQSLGEQLAPFLAADGIDFPPVSEWVAASRGPKRKDTRWQKRMRRNGGTLPPPPTKPADASGDPSAPKAD